MNRWPTLRRILYWGIPPVVLTLIAVRLDFARLAEVLAAVRPLPLAAGIVLYAAVIAIGALRWDFLLRQVGLAFRSRATAVVQYWKSLSIGYLTPGSLGADVYRVTLVGADSARYREATIVVVIEKFIALMSSMGLVLLLLPLLLPNRWSAMSNGSGGSAALLAAVSVACAVALYLGGRWGWFRWVWQRVEMAAEATAAKVATRRRTELPYSSLCTSLGWIPLARSLLSLHSLLPGVFLSLSIQLVAASQAQLYFHGVNYEIPFLANLLVTQMLYFLFILPVSLGGIGIREGAFVLLYGMFGVPMETALIVSFCSLLGVLLGHALGSLLFLGGREGRDRLIVNTR